MLPCQHARYNAKAVNANIPKVLASTVKHMQGRLVKGSWLVAVVRNTHADHLHHLQLHLMPTRTSVFCRTLAACLHTEQE